MREFTTEEVIKIIPLDQAKKDEILNAWPSYEEERKYTVGRECWKIFHTYRNELTGFIHTEYTREVELGKRKMTPTFLDEVEKEVESVFNELLAGKQSERKEISEIRSKLQNLITDNLSKNG